MCAFLRLVTISEGIPNSFIQAQNAAPSLVQNADKNTIVMMIANDTIQRVEHEIALQLELTEIQ